MAFAAQILNTICEKLQKYPDVKYEVSKTGLTIPAYQSSEFEFSVGLSVREDMYTVSFEGWHEHFNDPEEALNCFAFGLSEECRLKVLRRGKIDYKWVVQSRKDDSWCDDSECGLLFFPFLPFWDGKRERHLQNHLIKKVAPS